MSTGTGNQEAEARMFFAIATDLRNAERRGDDAEARYCLDEIGAMKMHTENRMLRARCAQILQSHA